MERKGQLLTQLDTRLAFSGQDKMLFSAEPTDVGVMHICFKDWEACLASQVIQINPVISGQRIVLTSVKR